MYEIWLIVGSFLSGVGFTLGMFKVLSVDTEVNEAGAKRG